MQVFKVNFVAPYSEQLQKLAADQTLRETMTGFALGSGAGAGIAPQHRPGWSNILLVHLRHKAVSSHMTCVFNVGTDMAVAWLERTSPLHECSVSKAKSLSCINQ